MKSEKTLIFLKKKFFLIDSIRSRKKEERNHLCKNWTISIDNVLTMINKGNFSVGRRENRNFGGSIWCSSVAIFSRAVPIRFLRPQNRGGIGARFENLIPSTVLKTPIEAAGWRERTPVHRGWYLVPRRYETPMVFHGERRVRPRS